MMYISTIYIGKSFVLRMTYLAHMTSEFRDICGYSPSELIHQGQELTETFGQKFSGLMKKKIKIENLI